MKTKYWHEKCFKYALITSFGTSQKFITAENLILKKKTSLFVYKYYHQVSGLEVCFACLL